MTSKLPPPTTTSSNPPTSKMAQKSKSFPTPLSIPPPQSLPKPTHSDKPTQAPSPHRTFSDPLPPPFPAFASDPSSSSSDTNLHRASTEGPKSAGYVGKNVRFGFGKHAEEGDKGRKIDALKRRHSNENHVNVYTDCGRHGDDWLFGGWSVGGVMRRVWGRKD